MASTHAFDGYDSKIEGDTNGTSETTSGESHGSGGHSGYP